MERGATVEVDQGGHDEQGPLPIHELQGRDHRDRDHRNGEDRRPDQTRLQVCGLGLAGLFVAVTDHLGVLLRAAVHGGGVLIPHGERVVSGTPHGFDQPIGVDFGGVVTDGGGFGGEVDGGLHAIELVELALHPP